MEYYFSLISQAWNIVTIHLEFGDLILRPGAVERFWLLIFATEFTSAQLGFRRRSNQETMASGNENFSRTGPFFLTPIDWSNKYHRQSVAACLVQGVYTMERDRQNNCLDSQALTPWWHFFNFKLHQELIDEHDSSIFGAIYEFNSSHQHNFHTRPPQYVIAFRGTIINKRRNLEQDLKHNFQCVINNLRESIRFQKGLAETCKLASRVGQGNVWLAGHSLGSSIALLVGRNMVKQTGMHLETYLFNPPFISLPIERIKKRAVKFGMHLATSVVTAALAYAIRGKDQEEDPFAVLSNWVPHLFVNPRDHICAEYLGYFEHREKMDSIGAGRIGRLATKHSIASIVSGASGKDCEASHLIPCAYVTVNVTPTQSFKEAHGIHQWWRQDLVFNHKSYQYK